MASNELVPTLNAADHHRLQETVLLEALGQFVESPKPVARVAR